MAMETFASAQQGPGEHQAREMIERVRRLQQVRAGADGAANLGKAVAALTELLGQVDAVNRRRNSSVPASPAPSASSKTVPAIPVLGRAAAAVPQFWVDLPEGEGLTNQLGPAVATLSIGERVACHSQMLGVSGRPHNVALVQLSQPVELAGLSISEVLESTLFASRWPDAFALRIEGDSMAPILQHGDLAVLSPRGAVRAGEPAIVQLAGQVGVSCKVYRRMRGKVRLIAANPAYPTTTHNPADVIWALRVLARVRLQ